MGKPRSKKDFERLLRRIEEPLLQYFRCSAPEGLLSRMEADDLLQETCATAWPLFEEFDGDTAKEFFLWMRAIGERRMKNLARTEGRIKRLWPKDHMDVRALKTADRAEKPSERGASGAVTVLRNCVKSLPGMDRLALMRYYHEGWPVPEIAQSLGISNCAARKRLERARKRLRREFQDRCEEGRLA